MKHSASTVPLLSLLLAVGPLAAQQAGARPVLSPAPAAAQAPAAPPAAAAPARGATPKPANVPDNYVIGPEDSIEITVWKEPSLSATLPVRPDGMITLPLVGDLPAAGFTPMQLASNISVKLQKFVDDPTVNVTVLEVNSKHVFLVGEVGRVGPLAILPGMTILQAISSAGGLTPYANKKHIYILRGDAGKQQKIPFDYTKAVKSGNMQGVTLMPGDTIVVP